MDKNKAKAVLALGKHLRTNCDKIFDKSIPFVIDSAIFWFITETIQSLLSSEPTLLPDACKNFYDYVMFLSDFFEQTPSLCITLADAVKGVNSIPGNLDLTFFRSLHFLELRKIPPHMITSLYAVKSNLRKLKCSRCLDSLSEILSSQQCSNNNSPQDNPSNSSSVTLVWPELREIDLSFNRISEIDQKATETFELTPLVENLNLSRNSIFSIDDTFSRVLNCLTTLNLNYNKLKAIPPIPPNCKTLLLSHNYITSLTCPAFQIMYQNVEVFDISTNMISDENELDALQNLRFIKNLVLMGNPISFLENYRNTVCCSINRVALNRTFVLDNKKLSISQVRRALESRKDYKFVPFNVAPTEEQLIPRQSTMSTCPSSLTQSYDSTVSSVRSSCPKKPKIRPVYVYDPDDEEESLSSKCDDKSQSSVNNPTSSGGSMVNKDSKESNVGADSETSEIKILATRNAIESLREKYGEENWLLKQAGVELAGIIKIPQSSSKPRSPTARLLSQSLPGSGGGLSSHSSNSLYTTAVEFDDSRIFKSANTDDGSEQPYSASSTSSTVQENESPMGVNAPQNAINDDSLIFYPCTSENETMQDSKSPQSIPTTGSSFRFVPSLAPPPSFTSTEIFVDPNGKALDFRYFQAGQMLKLVILDNYLYEIDKTTSSILNKWDLKSLESQSIEKCVSETETVEFKLTFDTMKKNLREKTLVMSSKDFAKFDETVAPFLERKLMQEFSEAFQCLKCNAQFSKGLANKSVCTDQDGQIKEVPICNNPDCGSELLVLLDSIPLPNNESLNVEEELLNLHDSRSSSPFSGSSTMAKPIQDTGLFRVPLACSTPKPLACSLTNNDIRGNEQFTDQTGYIDRRASQSSYIATRKKSKSSSEPASLRVINTKSDSDIETLSCNSSSIEVIGNNGDSGSSSDIAEVLEAVELTYTASTVSTCKHKSSKFPDDETSTSSGSCAESTCTLYEKRPAPGQQCQNATFTGASGFSTSISSSTVTIINQSQLSQTNSPSHGLTSYASIKFDYESFTRVDHRLQLFCEISVFKGSDERLLALAKVLVITESMQFPSIVIFSNQKLYIYKIVGMEGDKPDSWLQKVKSFRLTKLLCVNVLMGRHGVGMELQGGKKYYALVFRDSQRTSNFLERFLGDICGELELPPLVRDFSTTHKALLSPTNEVIYFGVLRFASCENGKSFATAAIMVTDIEVVLITELSWMAHYSSGKIKENSTVQQLNGLRQVESHENDNTFVRLIFGSANHVFWELYFESKEERLIFVTNLQPYAQGIPFISLSQPISITL